VNRAFIKVPPAGDYDVFALTFSSDFVLVVLADVVLPWHRDVVVLQQNRGRGHAISHVEEEVVGPGGVFVRWADPGAEAWRGDISDSFGSWRGYCYRPLQTCKSTIKERSRSPRVVME
jgi:hypothetical protein